MNTMKSNFKERAPMIQFEKVTKRYNNGHEALSEVSFQIARGEMVFLTGHSGAGKSTILKLLALMESVTRGQILLNGFAINRLPMNKIPYLRRSIGFIFQQPRLLLDRTLFDNIALPLIISGYTRSEMSRRVRAALDKVGLLQKEKLYPQALSSGEQQRASIARAIVNKPPLLLADEPTGNLDPTLSAEIMRLLIQFNQVGVALLVASHDFTLIKSMRRRVITLKQGVVVQDDLRNS